ncbi:MAG: hypothetical protein JZD41_05270 [Thermoproteus sp.]|nr:hypothetical protein [Thermoproteus sp.]
MKPLVLNDAEIKFRYWGYPYAIYAYLDEGIKVDLRTFKIECGTGPNEVYFTWPTNTALLCQVLGTLTNRWICHGLNRDDCCKLKRAMLMSLLK